MKKILFVCTGNTCRSPMAELIFNKLAVEKGLDVQAFSAGLCTIDGLLINENSAQALEEIGIESNFFRSSDIQELELNEFEKIYVMTDEHKAELDACVADGNKVCVIGEGRGICDPYGHGINVYTACRDEIIECVKNIIGDYENQKSGC